MMMSSKPPMSFRGKVFGGSQESFCFGCFLDSPSLTAQPSFRSRCSGGACSLIVLVKYYLSPATADRGRQSRTTKGDLVRKRCDN